MLRSLFAFQLVAKESAAEILASARLGATCKNIFCILLKYHCQFRPTEVFERASFVMLTTLLKSK